METSFQASKVSSQLYNKSTPTVSLRYRTIGRRFKPYFDFFADIIAICIADSYLLFNIL